MSETRKEPKKYKPRKSLRLPGYDYTSSGAYSCTLCTEGRHPYFKHPVLDRILKEEWANLIHHYVGVAPDILVVMPDHVHGILWIDATVEGSQALYTVIGGYKSIVSVVWLRFVKETGMAGSWNLWQRSFHDHVIRNEQDLVEKQRYALNNPLIAEMKKEQRRLKGS
ncbi:MAG: hypothetical protein NVSMB44_34420 [Ktedonobacteraceae bacterium]